MTGEREQRGQFIHEGARRDSGCARVRLSRGSFGVLRFIVLGLGACTSNTKTSDSQLWDPSGGDTRPILDAGDEPATPPSGPSLCPSGACNYQTGQGCDLSDGSAQTCLPSLNGPDGSVTPACEPAGSKAELAACSQWSDCAQGLFCAGAVCRKLCCGGDWTGCPSGEHCLTPIDFAAADGGLIVTGVMVCTPVDGCDPLSTSSCGAAAGRTCQVVDPTGATTCLPGGTSTGGVAGDPCPCRAGFMCVGGGCRRLCRAEIDGGEPSCPPEEGRCIHWSHDPSGVGECSPI